ncbi:hypothetical protein ACHQM5_006916 [Ranunculus cassubicifolius]
MASEASRSADSFIGSLISLTTKFEIRYKGVLQNINTEESSIGLINVKSYGTEGRKKDGQQIPPNDKIYEYILFRGSDIKDISVIHKPVQPTQLIYDDPAIIQSHYSFQPPVSTSTPSASSASVSNLSSQAPQMAAPRSSFESGPPLFQPALSSGSWGSSASPSTSDCYPVAGPTSHTAQLAVPLYQPGGSLGIWGSSPSPNTNGTSSGLSMPPMSWQGFYGPSNGPSNVQQQSLFQPPHGLPLQHSMPQPTYPASSAHIQSGSLNLPTSNLPLQPSFSIGSANLTTTTAQFSVVSPSLGSNTASTAVPSTMAQTAPIFPSVAASISTNTESTPPPLVTPSQLLQPTLSPLLPSDPATEDSQVVEASPSSIQAPPIQPLPSQRTYQEVHKPFQSHQNHSNRGRGRGWGNSISNSATSFTEEFDFMAMNEKFNKDEVWGDLGKSNNRKQADDDILASSLEKCIYKKDEFFDSISRQSPHNGQRNQGRNSGFNYGYRNDGETFGDIPSYRGGRGVHWSGRSRGPYYGRGYGYVGRGRGGY